MNSIPAELYTQLVKTASQYVQDDAEDAVQQAMAEYYTQGGVLPQGIATLATYLTKLVIWRCYNILAVRKNHLKWFVPLVGTEPGPHPATALQVKLDVQAALAELPADTRRVVILRLLEHKPIRDVAKLLHLSPRTCDRHLQAGRQALRIHLEVYAEDYRKYTGVKRDDRLS